MKDFKVYQASGLLNALVSDASDVRKKEQTLSGDLVSFDADAEFPVKIAVDINSSGWTGCEVIRSGINLFGGIKFAEDFSDRYNGVTVDTDSKTFSFAYNITQRVNHPIPLNFRFKENTSYTFIFTLKNTSIARPNLRIYYTGGTYENIPDLDGVNLKQTIVIHTSPNKTVGSIINRSQGGTTVVYYDECGMFEGNVAESDFISYQGTAYSIQFPAELGSVTEGTLTIDYDGSTSLVTGGQTYPLTSVSPIETLIGDNNIWADAGEVSVTYPI